MTLTIGSAPLGGALGAEVSGLDASAKIDEASALWLAGELSKHGVLVFRGLDDLSPQKLAELGRCFGTLAVTPADPYSVPDYPEVTQLSNRKVDGKPIGWGGEQTNEWHSDVTYTRYPPRGALLFGAEVPPQEAGGETPYINLCAAYDALPEDLKVQIESLNAIHRYPESYGGKLSDEDQALLPDVVHPVVIKHPRNGRKVLYVSPMMTVGIEGMSEEEGSELLSRLFEHSIDEKFTYVHKWESGDLLVWDNHMTMHRSTDFDQNYSRYMLRVMLEESETLAR